ncbi:EF-hand calcium-binding domain-containing protein 13 [Microcebus murinus]|uniref:EF-hand calcium-binding domain-containing protein 13 n=1 Tax=Microcebus murinus TaxID=30608 RepID=UPI003F6C0D05
MKEGSRKEQQGNPFVLLFIHTCSSRPLSPQGQNLPLNRKMETKVHLFCQTEENIDLSDDSSNSFATDLPSRNIDSKKYIKFSKTMEKKISPEIRGLSPEHKTMNKEMLSNLYLTLYEDVPYGHLEEISGNKRF